MHEKSFEHALNKLYHIIINKWPFFIPLPHESQLPVEFFIIKSLKLNILWIWPTSHKETFKRMFPDLQPFWEMFENWFISTALFSILSDSASIPVKNSLGLTWKCCDTSQTTGLDCQWFDTSEELLYSRPTPLVWGASVLQWLFYLSL